MTEAGFGLTGAVRDPEAPLETCSPKADRIASLDLSLLSVGTQGALGFTFFFRFVGKDSPGKDMVKMMMRIKSRGCLQSVRLECSGSLAACFSECVGKS